MMNSLAGFHMLVLICFDHCSTPTSSLHHEVHAQHGVLLPDWRPLCRGVLLPEGVCFLFSLRGLLRFALTSRVSPQLETSKEQACVCKGMKCGTGARKLQLFHSFLHTL